MTTHSNVEQQKRGFPSSCFALSSPELLPVPAQFPHRDVVTSNFKSLRRYCIRYLQTQRRIVYVGSDGNARVVLYWPGHSEASGNTTPTSLA